MPSNQFIVPCADQPSHGESISYDETQGRWCFNKTNGGYFIDPPHAIGELIPRREEWVEEVMMPGTEMVMDIKRSAASMPDYKVRTHDVVTKVEAKHISDRVKYLLEEFPDGDWIYDINDGDWVWLITTEPVDAET